jgi:hypothetical protein
VADTERTKFRGRLAEKDDERHQLKIKIDLRRDQLRDLLDPFADPKDMNGEKIMQLSIEMATYLIDYGAVMAEIAAIKKALGVD